MTQYRSLAKIILNFSSTDEIELAFISDSLNLKPNVCYKKGEHYLDWGVAKFSVWKCLFIEGDAYEEMDINLVSIIGYLEDYKENIKAILNKNIDAQVNIIVTKVSEDDVGLDLGVSLIKRLYDLGLSLQFNVFDEQ